MHNFEILLKNNTRLAWKYAFAVTKYGSTQRVATLSSDDRLQKFFLHFSSVYNRPVPPDTPDGRSLFVDERPRLHFPVGHFSDEEIMTVLQDLPSNNISKLFNSLLRSRLMCIDEHLAFGQNGFRRDRSTTGHIIAQQHSCNCKRGWVTIIPLTVGKTVEVGGKESRHACLLFSLRNLGDFSSVGRDSKAFNPFITPFPRCCFL